MILLKVSPNPKKSANLHQTNELKLQNDQTLSKEKSLNLNEVDGIKEDDFKL